MTYINQGYGNASLKRCKRGNEKRWNQLGEPFAHMLGGKFIKTLEWVNRKVTRNERKYSQLSTSDLDKG